MNLPPSIRRRVFSFSAGVLLVILGGVLLVKSFKDIAVLRQSWPRRAVTGLSMQLPALPQAAPVEVSEAQAGQQIVKVERHDIEAENCTITILHLTYRENATLETEVAAVVEVGAGRLLRSVVTEVQVADVPARRVEMDFHATGRVIRRISLCVVRGRDAWRVSVSGPAEDAARVAERLLPTVEFSS